MKQNTFNSQNQQNQSSGDQFLRVTALIYLEEALRQQQYEECAGLIQEAKNLGVEHRQVRGVLQKYIKEQNPQREGVSPKRKTRRRF